MAVEIIGKLELDSVIKDFENWAQEEYPKARKNKTMEGGQPVYENKMIMILFGTFCAGYVSRK